MIDQTGIDTSEDLRLLRAELENHRVFRALEDRTALARFMQVHVFAVWDFMSLAKRLQRDLSCVELPWLPPADPAASRLINEIILAEESDVGSDGKPASHLELYLAAMREVGADTEPFEAFMTRLRSGLSVEQALLVSEAPVFVGDFVRHTMDIALKGSTLQVMASFFYGRENVIPSMFQGLLDRWRIAPASAPAFVYYLKRHIELDGDSHGPAASRLIATQLANAPHRVSEAYGVARASLIARRDLWNGTLRLLRSRTLRTPALAQTATQAQWVANG
jgi:Protein of unknown function (DUF3050)